MTTWLKYGDRPELAAVSLRSSATGLGKISKGVNITPSNVPNPIVISEGNFHWDNFYQRMRPQRVFLYQLPTFFCSSPHPRYWTQFIAQYSNQFGPCPPRFDCSTKFKLQKAKHEVAYDIFAKIRHSLG